MKMKKLLVLLVFLTAFTVSHAKEVLICDVKGIISGYTNKYLEEALKKAANENAVLMIRLDTPGGVLESTRDIVQQFFKSNVPIIVYVAPQGARAGSAGTFITLAADFAVMSEGSNIGAAHPVNITGEDIKGDMAEKIENDTVAFMRSIAQKQGRDADAAVLTVTESLSYTAQEALEKNLINAVANTDMDAAKLAGAKLGFTVDKITELKPSPLQKTAFFLSDPNILILLLFIGIAAVFLEFKMPGTFVFAGIGIAALILFLAGINIIPVNSLALLLILGGLGLLAAEVFLPSFGLLTLASVICMGFGMYLMFSKEGNMGIGVSFWLILTVIGTIAALVLFIGRLILKDFRTKPVTGQQGLIGLRGEVKDWDGTHGHVFLHGELWKAKSTEIHNKRDIVTVVSVNGMELTVEAAKDE